MKLHLGPGVVRLLLPHRRPFLMVDAVVEYEHGPVPELRAQRFISSNEPVFEGHFPGFTLWPGVYTIEGMGQATNLLHVIWTMVERTREAGATEDDTLLALRNVELGCRMDPGYRADRSAGLEAVLRSDAGPAAHIGMAAAVDVKLKRPVFAGERLDYHARQTHVLDHAVRFEVEASVDGRVVAGGTLTSTRGAVLPALVTGQGPTGSR